MLDPTALFESHKFSHLFDDELDAVRSGKKPMLLVSIPGAVLETTDPNDEQRSEYMTFMLEAAKCGLLIVHDTETFMVHGSQYLNLRILILRKDQVWRVPALLAVLHAFRSRLWSDGAEALRSALLGYTDDQINEWLAYQRHAHSGWGCATIYGLISVTQLDQLRALGMRSMPEEIIRSVRWLHVRDQSVLRTNAHQLSAPNLVCRAGMQHASVMKMTSQYRGRSDVSVADLDRSSVDITEWNGALCSRIEVWTSAGWQ